jgi:hypothetical protein
MMTAAISTSWTNALSDEDLSSRFSHLVTAEYVAVPLISAHLAWAMT